MAISVNGGGYGSRRRGGGSSSLAEINVTPFVDVVLVLLIIFMLTAHVMEFGIQVDVPKVNLYKDSAQELPVVTITKSGETTLNGKLIDINELVYVVHQRFPQAKGVYVRADKECIWDPIAQVTAALGQGGLQVNMVTQPLDTSRGR